LVDIVAVIGIIASTCAQTGVNIVIIVGHCTSINVVIGIDIII
jgi:hypothetical protein